MSTEREKWACDYCTYENYPSAIKCTMCRASRALIEQSDIYELCQPAATSELCTGKSSPKPGGAEATTANEVDLQEQFAALQLADDVLNDQLKWICQRCTYQNWTRAMRCAMCSHKRQTVNSPETACGVVSADNRLQAMRESPPHDFPVANNNSDSKRWRRHAHQADWPWLDACIGVIQGDANPVEAYLASGGDPTRQLTATEVALLNRPSAFDVGHTLVHLAIRFQKEDLLATLLSQIEGGGAGIKRVPSYVAPELAADVRRQVASLVRQRKGVNFPCFYVADVATFALPAEVEDLPQSVQEQLYDELLDRDAQTQLENDPPALNWSLEITMRLGSRLFALWNRSAGDCLLDSAMQASWGVFDRDNTLRRAIAESLRHGGHIFYPRWREYEELQASLMHFSLDDSQWEEDWSGLLSLAAQPGASLEQLHVFALAHVLRRPIIVYGVKFVKSFRGEALGYARFEGVYLPLLWDRSFCHKSPLALGYTRGHFSALVPIEPYMNPIRGATPVTNDDLQVTFLPLQSHDRKLLPVHFLTHAEVGMEEALLRQWLDVCVTEGGLLVAQQRLDKRPLLVAQMIEEWLNHYRRLGQTTAAPFSRTVAVQDYSSDGDSDDE
ncbi:ubiquitin thioesterase trabid [Neocloeon triangulifer]|uniref:ubiquitin thioesterase trabid n=1 Tax=Neocloeon triangulifer TaxID=2078957 RepID=UPI00286EBFC7|nr:ubiquitin thioesterase trabid [Neocloeon triangulifer]